MSYENGIAAINLEMTDRVPRTEYSVERHWELVKVETSIEISDSSSPEEKADASQQLFKVWNFDLIWNILHIHDTDFTKLTKMGHASFESDGSDFDNQMICPFKTPKEALSFNAMEEFGLRVPFVRLMYKVGALSTEIAKTLFFCVPFVMLMFGRPV